MSYFEKSGISASFLKSCSFSAYHGWKHLHDPFKPTDAMNFGSAVHCALLEPDKFIEQFVVSPKFDRRTKEGKALAEAFETSSKGKTVLNEDDYSQVNRIVQRCLEIEIVREAIRGFEKEKEFYWDNFKAKLDLVDVYNGVIIDVKTTRDAEPRAFVSQSLALRYDIQLLHYAKALKKPVTAYAIAIESDSAQVACYDLTDIVFSDFTKKRYEMALKTAIEVLDMKECPPKYSSQIVNLTLPKWAQEEV